MHQFPHYPVTRTNNIFSTEPLTTTSELPKPSVELPEHLKGKVEIDMEELPDDEDEPYHDEL
jgi:hypothetical protein